MSRIERTDVVDYQTYADQRDAWQERVFPIKSVRRIHVGEYLTFLFENKATLLYQVQEMMRVERIVREADIQHEIDTYSALLGGDGEVGCTLLIEIQDKVKRAELLTAWKDLPGRLYILLDNGERAFAKFDEEQVGDDRLSSVQYLSFNIGEHAPVALGSDLPEHRVEAQLTEAQKAALLADAKE